MSNENKEKWLWRIEPAWTDPVTELLTASTGYGISEIRRGLFSVMNGFTPVGIPRCAAGDANSVALRTLLAELRDVYPRLGDSRPGRVRDFVHLLVGEYGYGVDSTVVHYAMQLFFVDGQAHAHQLRAVGGSVLALLTRDLGCCVNETTLLMLMTDERVEPRRFARFMDHIPFDWAERNRSKVLRLLLSPPASRGGWAPDRLRTCLADFSFAFPDEETVEKCLPSRRACLDRFDALLASRLYDGHVVEQAVLLRLIALDAVYTLRVLWTSDRIDMLYWDVMWDTAIRRDKDDLLRDFARFMGRGFSVADATTARAAGAEKVKATIDLYFSQAVVVLPCYYWSAVPERVRRRNPYGAPGDERSAGRRLFVDFSPHLPVKCILGY